MDWCVLYVCGVCMWDVWVWCGVCVWFSGPFLLSWMPQVFSTDRYCSSPFMWHLINPTLVSSATEFLTLLIGLIHYNATYIDEDVLTGIVQ